MCAKCARVDHIKLSIKPHDCMCGKPCLHEESKGLVESVKNLLKITQEDTTFDTEKAIKATHNLRDELAKWEKRYGKRT